MALSTKDIYNVLKEFNEYGATIYYLLENKKMKLDDISDILLKDSIEKINLVFPKLISKITLEDIDEGTTACKSTFTKLSCLDRIIEQDDGKHQHLKEIRDIVNLDKKISKMIKEKTYETALNLHYTEKILKEIEKREAKGYFSRREMLKLYDAALDLLQKENDKKISSNIDNYYISMITS